MPPSANNSAFSRNNIASRCRVLVWLFILSIHPTVLAEHGDTTQACGVMSRPGVPAHPTPAPGLLRLHPATQLPPCERPMGRDEHFENPVTGERGRITVLPWEHADGTLVGTMTARAGARVAGEHMHPTLRERFEVITGELMVLQNGDITVLQAGDVAEIAPGVWHDWWNSSSVPAVVRLEVAPGERFLHMLETLFGLAHEGYTDQRGMPNLLQLAMLDQEFCDVVIFRRPPVIVQRALFTLLRPVARALGYRPTYPMYSRTVFAPRGPLATSELQSMDQEPHGMDQHEQ